MRRSLCASLFGLLLLAAPLAGGTTVVGAGPDDIDRGHRHDVQISGTVTGMDGAPADDAVVLFGADATLTKFSPDELRDLAAADPANLTVVAADSEGRFEATVAWDRAEAAVALTDDGVSDLVFLGRENGTVDVRLYERRPQTVHAHVGAVSNDERRGDLFVNLVNSGDTAVENLSVTLVSIPDGWSVAEVETVGRYSAERRTLTWSSVAPGAAVDTTVVLSVPAGTPPGEYAVELRAGSDTHRVDVESETVEVLPEETPGPTTTPPPGDRATPTSSPPSPATDGTGGTTPSADASGPGLGVAAAVTGLALATALLVRRR